MSGKTLVKIIDRSPDQVRETFHMESSEAMGFLHMTGKGVSINNRNFLVETVRFEVDTQGKMGWAELVVHGQFSWEKRT